MQRVLVETINEGKYSLEAVVVITGDGINIYLGGGEKPHLGTVVISQPRPSLKGDGTISCTTSVFNFMHHKDDGLAVPLAELICKSMNTPVVVTAGVHIDSATGDDIDKLYHNMEKLGALVLQKLSLAEGK